MSDPKSPKKQKERMESEQYFRFRCGPGVPCFTQCCQDVVIVLTPYDVVRLKNALGISSEEFIDRYTIIIPKQKRLIPLVLLKMDEKDKKCPFVRQEGCSVYKDRPWPCRMYPLDMDEEGLFFLITDPSRCQGLNQSEEWRIADWLADQDLVPYDEMNALFGSVTGPLQTHELDIENPGIGKMVFMALYNVDKFRDFVLKSSFLDRFHVEESRVEKIKQSDLELLKFGFDWIKFGLFGQKLFSVKQKAAR
jgi:Fe-S-cluster containining protein